jgi:hypothetical protein
VVWGIVDDDILLVELLLTILALLERCAVAVAVAAGTGGGGGTRADSGGARVDDTFESFIGSDFEGSVVAAVVVVFDATPAVAAASMVAVFALVAPSVLLAIGAVVLELFEAVTAPAAAVAYDAMLF